MRCHGTQRVSGPGYPTPPIHVFRPLFVWQAALSSAAARRVSRHWKRCRAVALLQGAIGGCGARRLVQSMKTALYLELQSGDQDRRAPETAGSRVFSAVQPTDSPHAEGQQERKGKDVLNPFLEDDGGDANPFLEDDVHSEGNGAVDPSRGMT